MTDVSPFTRIAQESPEAAGLVGQIVMAGYNAYADSSQKLIDSLQLTIAERDAELAIIKENIEELCSKPWAPSTNAVLAALFVTRQRIAQHIELNRSES
jgi:hypothetical protein